MPGLEKDGSGSLVDEVIVETLHALADHLNNLRKRVSRIIDPADPGLPTNESIYAKLIVLIRNREINYDGLALLVEITLREYDHFYTLVDNLLGFYSVHDAGPNDATSRLQLSEGDLKVVVDEVIELFEPWAAEREIEIRPSLPVEAPAWFDIEKVRRAIVNIMANAVKYSDPRPGSVPARFIYINLRRHSTEGAWRIEFESVSKTHVERGEEAKVLEHGYRGESARRSNVRGTGIGLAEANRIARQHSGSVSIRSDPFQNHPELYTTTTRLVVKSQRPIRSRLR